MRVSLRDLASQCVTTLWAHRLRCALTGFGIAWGIASLLLLASIGEGFRRAQKREFDKTGEDVIFLFPGRVVFGQGTRTGARAIFFNYGDYEAVAACPLVGEATPVVGQANVRMTTAANSANFGVAGVLPSYFDLRFTPHDTGRLLSLADSDEQRQVVVVGSEIQRTLFAGRSPLGESLYINRIPFTVVGTLRQVGEPPTVVNLSAYIPFQTGQKFFPTPGSPERQPINTMILRPTDPGRNLETVAQVRNALGKRHGFGPEHRDAVENWDGIELYRQVLVVTRIMDLFLGGVGVVTLTLGAVGVMNIMLLTVAERTVEIGLRRATGATASDILWQFFLEALALTLGAGAAGLLAGWGATRLLAELPYPRGFGAPVMTLQLALAGLAVLAAVALTAGLYPAWRAASLAPAEALRSET